MFNIISDIAAVPILWVEVLLDSRGINLRSDDICIAELINTH
jgi:hypothetical protein